MEIINYFSEKIKKLRNFFSSLKEKNIFSLKKINYNNILFLGIVFIFVQVMVLCMYSGARSFSTALLFFKENYPAVVLLSASSFWVVTILYNWKGFNMDSYKRTKRIALGVTLFLQIWITMVLFNPVTVKLSGVQRQNLIDSVRIAMIADTSTTSEPNKFLIEMKKFTDAVDTFRKELPEIKHTFTTTVEKIQTTRPVTLVPKQQDASVSFFETKESSKKEKTTKKNRVSKKETLKKQKKAVFCHKPVHSLRNYTFTRDGKIVPG